MNDICATSSIVNNLSRKFNKVRKKQVSIDSYCMQYNIKPDLIKIDVEGAEVDVLKGAKNIMHTCKPIIFLSIHPREIAKLGYTDKDLLDVIQSSNYRLTNMDGSDVVKFSYIEYILKYKK